MLREYKKLVMVQGAPARALAGRRSSAGISDCKLLSVREIIVVFHYFL